jgi:arylsulfatase A-like enzyme
VPLIVRLPGVVNKGQVISTPVSILDIAPTITDLTVRDSIAQKKVALTFGGRSLADALTDAKTLTRRRIYNVTFPGKKGYAPRWLSWMWIDSDNQSLRFGYVDGATKLIWSPGDELLHSYDVARDPLEHQPATLTAASPPYAAETQRLKSWYSRTEFTAGEELLSKRDIEVLKSLGYVQ